MICLKCNSVNKKEANFCVYCGTKLKQKCNCWMKKKDNYDCGESSCPGYGLFRKELIKLESPVKRLGGIDMFAVQRSAEQILKAAENARWTKGEVEQLPMCLEKMIKANDERAKKGTPFVICEYDHPNS